MRMTERLSVLWWALCAGFVALFVFFAAIGGVSLLDIALVTAAVAIMAALFVVHQVRVRRALGEANDPEFMEAWRRTRERRGF